MLTIFIQKCSHSKNSVFFVGQEEIILIKIFCFGRWQPWFGSGASFFSKLYKPWPHKAVLALSSQFWRNQKWKAKAKNHFRDVGGPRDAIATADVSRHWQTWDVNRITAGSAIRVNCIRIADNWTWVRSPVHLRILVCGFVLVGPVCFFSGPSFGLRKWCSFLLQSDTEHVSEIDENIKLTLPGMLPSVSVPTQTFLERLRNQSAWHQTLLCPNFDFGAQQVLRPRVSNLVFCVLSKRWWLSLVFPTLEHLLPEQSQFSLLILFWSGPNWSHQHFFSIHHLLYLSLIKQGLKKSNHQLSRSSALQKLIIRRPLSYPETRLTIFTRDWTITWRGKSTWHHVTPCDTSWRGKIAILLFPAASCVFLSLLGSSTLTETLGLQHEWSVPSTSVIGSLTWTKGVNGVQRTYVKFAQSHSK